jgi:hypothetical protein
MPDRLVLPDRPPANDAFLGIVGRALERRLAGTKRGSGDVDALRVQAVQQTLKPLPLLADAIVDRDFEPVDEGPALPQAGFAT